MVYAIFNLLIVYGNIQTEHFKYYEPLKSWESLVLMDKSRVVLIIRLSSCWHNKTLNIFSPIVFLEREKSATMLPLAGDPELQWL